MNILLLNFKLCTVVVWIRKRENDVSNKKTDSEPGAEEV